MKKLFRVLTGVFLGIVVLASSSCTVEKAEALKLSAEKFRDEARIALNQINNILKESIAMPEDYQEQIFSELQQLKPDQFDIEKFNFLLSERNIGVPEQMAYSQDIQSITAHYESFAAMFENLPQGQLFAADAVQKAQKHGINLTLQLIDFAKLLNDNKIIVKANAKRILLFEQIQQNLAIKDQELRTKVLKDSSKLIDNLVTEELQTRETAIKQCLKAAEAGKLSTSLIRDYKKMSLSDIMILMKGSLQFLANITSQKTEIVSLLNQYKSFETNVRNDPYFNKLLDQK